MLQRSLSPKRRAAALAALATIFVLFAVVKVATAHWQSRSKSNGFVNVAPLSPEEQRLLWEEAAEGRRLMEGGEHYKKLILLTDYPGVSGHDLLKPDEVDLPPTTPVAGVEVDGKHFAFVLEPMAAPERHIVNLMLNQLPISVSYCNLADCVRVLTRKPAELLNPTTSMPLQLGVGGLDIDKRMVVLLDGQRYSQTSPQIPAIDHPFERMNWGDWLKKHPGTLVYDAPPIVASQ